MNLLLRVLVGAVALPVAFIFFSFLWVFGVVRDYLFLSKEQRDYLNWHHL